MCEHVAHDNVHVAFSLSFLFGITEWYTSCEGVLIICPQDLIIEATYAGIMHAKLDQKNAQVRV